jgi:hypothetical protein
VPRAGAATSAESEIERRSCCGWIDSDLQKSAAVAVPAARKACVNDPHDPRQPRSLAVGSNPLARTSLAKFRHQRPRSLKTPTVFDSWRGLQNQPDVADEPAGPHRSLAEGGRRRVSRRVTARGSLEHAAVTGLCSAAREEVVQAPDWGKNWGLVGDLTLVPIPVGSWLP